MTEPLRAPLPDEDLTFGQCASEYAPALLEVIRQCNVDRARVRALNGQAIEELVNGLEQEERPADDG